MAISYNTDFSIEENINKLPKVSFINSQFNSIYFYLSYIYSASLIHTCAYERGETIPNFIDGKKVNNKDMFFHDYIELLIFYWLLWTNNGLLRCRITYKNHECIGIFFIFYFCKLLKKKTFVKGYLIFTWWALLDAFLFLLLFVITTYWVVCLH